MAIVPDTKDWTWVLDRPCPDCGFDTRPVRHDDIPRILRQSAEAFRHELTTRSDVSARPSPSVWSPLEYGCHVRDVYRRFDVRLEQMLTDDTPRFANWDQDATAVEDRYAEQDPAMVAAEMERAAARIAERFEAVHDGEWSRPGIRSDGARFTVETLGRYLVHDPVHHLFDITGRRAVGGNANFE